MSSTDEEEHGDKGAHNPVTLGGNGEIEGSPVLGMDMGGRSMADQPEPHENGTQKFGPHEIGIQKNVAFIPKVAFWNPSTEHKALNEDELLNLKKVLSKIKNRKIKETDKVTVRRMGFIWDMVNKSCDDLVADIAEYETNSKINIDTAYIDGNTSLNETHAATPDQSSQRRIDAILKNLTGVTRNSVSKVDQNFISRKLGLSWGHIKDNASSLLNPSQRKIEQQLFETPKTTKRPHEHRGPHSRILTTPSLTSPLPKHSDKFILESDGEDIMQMSYASVFSKCSDTDDRDNGVQDEEAWLSEFNDKDSVEVTVLQEAQILQEFELNELLLSKLDKETVSNYETCKETITSKRDKAQRHFPGYAHDVPNPVALSQDELDAIVTDNFNALAFDGRINAVNYARILGSNRELFDDELTWAFFNTIMMQSARNVGMLDSLYLSSRGVWRDGYFNGDLDKFEIAILPIHIRGGVGHWVLGIYEREHNTVYYYDSLANPLSGEVRNMILKAVNAITRGSELNPQIIEIPESQLHVQVGGVNCGLHMALNAEAHILNNRVTRTVHFDIDFERGRVLQILSAYLPGKDGIPCYVAPTWFGHQYVPMVENDYLDDVLSDMCSEHTTENANISVLSQYSDVKLKNRDFDEFVVNGIISSQDAGFMKLYYTDFTKQEKQESHITTEYKRIQRKIHRFLQTEDEKQKAKERNAEEHRRSRENQEVEEKAKKSKRQSQSRNESRWESRKIKMEKGSKYKAATTTIETERFDLGEMQEKCIHCHAQYFEAEHKASNAAGEYHGCCDFGRIDTANIEIDPNPPFPKNLQDLFVNQQSSFVQNIRRINGDFALASMKVQEYEFDKASKYNCFRIHGQIYRSMNIAAKPNEGSQAKGGQIFFYDPNEAVELRKKRAHCPQGILKTIEDTLRENNRYVKGYTMMKDEIENQAKIAQEKGEPEKDVKLMFGINPGDDDRKYNIPQANEVAAVFVPTAEGDVPTADIVIHEIGKQYQTLKHIDEKAEPFLYPLFKPNGEHGWNTNMKKKAVAKKKRTKISIGEYYKFWLSYRNWLLKSDDDNMATFFNPMHYGGRLFQQWIVEQYCRVEQDRLLWVRLNQDKCKAANYTVLHEWLEKKKTELNANKIGRTIILPSDFVGSPRYELEAYLDEMAICAEFGKPDLFITFTCNGNDPDIVRNLPKGHGSENHPALVARVFKAKLDELIHDITKKGIFGKVLAWCYKVEFQKRGLPHAHILVTLQKSEKWNVETIDRCGIWAHIPTFEECRNFYQPSEEDQTKMEEVNLQEWKMDLEIKGYKQYERLKALVKKNMIHGPCTLGFKGQHPCRKHEKCDDCRKKPKHDRTKNCPECLKNKTHCSKNFPKNEQENTDVSGESYPLYRRPAMKKEDQFCVGKSKNIFIDNRWIVPYNPWLLLKYESHINVELIATIKSVKYIFKYIHKGYDSANIKLSDDSSNIVYDEINRYLEMRYIGPGEAAWRLLQFDLNQKSHSVMRLRVHLEEDHEIRFDEKCTDAQIEDMMKQDTHLLAFFRLNRRNKAEMAEQEKETGVEPKGLECTRPYDEHPVYLKDLLFKDIPKYFTWKEKDKENDARWVKRKAHFNTIGRVYPVPPNDSTGRFHLRILLNHVTGPTGYADLLTDPVTGEPHTTFQQACLARGLIEDDAEYIDAMEEASLTGSSKQIRNLFVLILSFCNPAKPEVLWEKFKDKMVDDLKKAYPEYDIETLYRLALTIIYENFIKNDKDPARDLPSMPNVDLTEFSNLKADYDAAKHLKKATDSRSKMNKKQGEVYDTMESLLRGNSTSTQRCYFLAGSGGTGKTFIYNALYHLVMGLQKHVICTAFSGIAATILPHGMTNHKMLKMPLNIDHNTNSNICLETPEANLLKDADIIIWDEAPMSPKYVLNICNQKLCEIMENKAAFGDKIMLLGGDFKQILPVKRYGIPSEVIDLSIKKSPLWAKFQVMELDENMRADPNEKAFAKDIVDIGNGLKNDKDDKVELPAECITHKSLHDVVFKDIVQKKDWKSLGKRAILSPLNVDVEKSNEAVLNMLLGDLRIFYSQDKQSETDQAPRIPDDVLSSFSCAGLPPHKLKLKIEAIVMLLRNLILQKGLCNGTRLQIVKMYNHLLECKIISGERADEVIFLPRITLVDTEHFGCELHRRQFPIKLAFAMTINKSQGQTLQYVGLDLTRDVFSHGQLYVGISRVPSWKCLKVKVPKDNKDGRVKNIVWKEALL